MISLNEYSKAQELAEKQGVTTAEVLTKFQDFVNQMEAEDICEWCELDTYECEC